jgi:hypothetical protein
MRVSRLVLALTLGVSTIATAQPQRSPDQHGDRDRGDRVGQWIALSGSIPATQRRNVIAVDANAGRFEKVRVTIDSGWVYVTQIAIEVAPNRWRRYRFNRSVRVDGSIEVALPGGGREISRIAIQTKPALGRGRGSFSVLGQRAGG